MIDYQDRYRIMRSGSLFFMKKKEMKSACSEKNNLKAGAEEH